MAEVIVNGQGGVRTIFGTLDEVAETHVTITFKKPRSSAQLTETFIRSKVVELGGVEGEDGFVKVEVPTQELSYYNGAVSFNEDGDIVVDYATKDGDQTVTIQASADVTILGALDGDVDEAPAKPAAKKGAAKPAAAEPAKRGRGAKAAAEEPADEDDDQQDDDAGVEPSEQVEMLTDLDDEQVAQVAVEMKLTTAKKADKMDRDDLEALFEDADLDEMEAAIGEVAGDEAAEDEPEPEPEPAPAKRGRKAAAEEEPAPAKRGAGRGGSKPAAAPEKSGRGRAKENW